MPIRAARWWLSTVCATIAPPREYQVNLTPARSRATTIVSWTSE
jgi:hypothetical protein